MDRRVLVAGVVVLGSLVVTAAWAAPLAVRRIGDRFDRVTGRDDLKVLERDPVLAFRAPGATLRQTVKQRRYAGSPGRQYEPAMVKQDFEVEGDPLAALEAYRERAEAEGWRFVRSQCSRYRRDATLSLTKSTPIPAVVTVGTVLAGAPPGGGPAPGAATTPAPVLTLTLTAQDGLGELGPLESPLGDIGCLRSIDPEDPAFKVRPGPARTSTEICALLPVDRAQQIVPDVTVAKPRGPEFGRGGCNYEQHPYTPPSTRLPVQARIDSRWWFSVVDAGGYPRIKYEERKHPSAATTANVLLFTSEVDRGAGPPINAWVDTPTGPVELSTGLVDGLDERQLVVVGELLATSRP